MNRLRKFILQFIEQFIKEYVGNNRGGAHIYVLGLMAISAMAIFFIVTLNVGLHYTSKDRIKHSIDSATHAASLDIDPTEASRGRLVWDISKGTDSFYTYLRKNLHLDTSNNPLPGSSLTSAPTVHFLGFITHPNYPFTYTQSLTIHPGTPQQTIRTIDTILYGPSVVAIIEVDQKMFGQSRGEPILISSASSVRKR